MRQIEFELNGRRYQLLFNGAALFDCYDHFGTKGQILDRIDGTTRESFDATCWMLAKLSQQGELLRRYQGETPAPMLTLEQATKALSPLDLLAARDAIRQAVHSGFAREEEKEEEEVDLGLQELQKKTEVRSPGPDTSNGRLSFWDWLRRKVFCCRSDRSSI